MIDFNDPIGREFLSFVDRLKYERWLGAETSALLEREFGRLVDLIISSKYRDLTPDQRQRAAELFREISKRVSEMYREVTEMHVDAMKAYATVEAEFSRATIEGLVGRSIAGPFLPRAYLNSIARLPIQGLNIGEWFEAQAQRMTVATKRIIQQGLVEGKGPLQIASRIVASDKAAGPVLIRQARNEARIISRTTVNAVQNDAQMASLTSLPESVSDSYVIEAVLDSRTSDICRALSGRVYKYDDPRRRVPPFHPNCRTSVRGLLKGIDEPISDQKTPRTMRNYSTWLEGQPVTTQNEILGRGRADLWRNGMSLADTIDGDGRVMTLKQLRASLLKREGVGAT